MVLFPDPQQARTEALGMSEPAVHGLAELTWPELVVARQHVNEWYAAFPDADGKIATRLRSEVDAEHYQALDELFVHHLLRRTHDDVRYEEEEGAPDFRAYGAADLVCSVEVATLFMRDDWNSEWRAAAWAVEEINRRLAPQSRYWLSIEVQAFGSTPSPRRLVNAIEDFLGGLPDPAEARDRPGRNYEYLYAEREARIRIVFLPRHGASDATAEPTPAMAGAMGGWVNSGTRLKRVIGAKSGGRYDLGDRPFLVVVSIRDMFCSDDQVDTSLYGNEAVQLPSGRAIRRNDGLFGRDRKAAEGRQRRVSAVGIIRDFAPWQPDAAHTYIYENPFPLHQWPSEVLSHDRRLMAVEEPGRVTMRWDGEEVGAA